MLVQHTMLTRAMEALVWKYADVGKGGIAHRMLSVRDLVGYEPFAFVSHLARFVYFLYTRKKTANNTGKSHNDLEKQRAGMVSALQ